MERSTSGDHVKVPYKGGPWDGTEGLVINDLDVIMVNSYQYMANGVAQHWQGSYNLIKDQWGVPVCFTWGDF